MSGEIVRYTRIAFKDSQYVLWHQATNWVEMFEYDDNSIMLLGAQAYCSVGLANVVLISRNASRTGNLQSCHICVMD